MKYWLMKNEPEDYGIDDLKKDKTEHWDGIRNYQVRNMIRDDMSIGDIAFFYHSNCEIPGIYGLMTINSKAYPDHTAFDKKAKYYDVKSHKNKPTWLMVDVKYKRKLPNAITLKELKSKKKLSEMRVVQKGNRLSITEVTKKDWEYILSLEKK